MNLLEFESLIPSNTSGHVVIAVALLFYTIWRILRHWLESKKPFSQLPMPPGNHWLFGHLMNRRGTSNFQDRMKRLMVDHANQHGQTGYWILRHKAIAVSTHQDARTVLNAEHERLRLTFMNRHLNEFLGSRNLGALKGREWKFHRSIVTRSFASESTWQRTAQVVTQVTNTLIKAIQAEISSTTSSNFIERDVEPLMKMITIDVFGQVAMSMDLECCSKLKPSPIAQAFDYLGQDMTRRITEGPLRLWNTYYNWPTAANLKHGQKRKIIRFFLQAIVSERQIHGKPDVLSQLVEAQKEDQDKTDDVSRCETLIDILMSLLFAGYDTTSITLTYALYNLAQHPQAQQECWNEITAATTTAGSPLPFDQLVFVQAVILETLRLFPPGVATSRALRKPLQLSGGLTVPPKTTVSIPIWFIQRNENYFPKATEFHPERWVARKNGSWVERSSSNDKKEAIPTANRDAFFAFSAGARSCAGQKFALHEAVLALSGLVSKLRFEVVPGYRLEPTRHGLVQHPKGGMPMRISLR